MGCGTGELTQFLAEQVGQDGEVVGVDPDEERIRLAVAGNLVNFPGVTIQIGDSECGFPHANENYYDIHFNNLVLHWLRFRDRQLYVKKKVKVMCWKFECR